MAAAADTGVDCVVTVGGVALPAILRGCTPDFQRQLRPILVATGGNPLIGYAASTGARSGAQLNFGVPYSGGVAALNALLATTPFDIAIGFGTAGGVTVAGCLTEQLEVSGSEGGDVEARAQLQSINLPAAGTATAGTIGDIFKFTDVDSFTGPGKVHTDLSQFSFRVQRTLIAYRGNSATGIPKRLRVGHTEVALDCTYLRDDDSELTASLGDCPTGADSSIAMSAKCSVGAVTQPTDTLTLTALAAVHNGTPRSSGDVEQWIQEAASLIAALGAFTVAA